MAGSGLIPEAVVVVLQFAFETLRLHRIEVAIIPRNTASRRVVEKLGLRSEGSGARISGDQRCVGGPRPLRHDLRRVDGQGTRTPGGLAQAKLRAHFL